MKAGISFDSREQAIMSVLLPAMMAEAHRAVSRSAHAMSAKAQRCARCIASPMTLLDQRPTKGLWRLLQRQSHRKKS
jgi:hypothetical protein